MAVKQVDGKANEPEGDAEQAQRPKRPAYIVVPVIIVRPDAVEFVLNVRLARFLSVPAVVVSRSAQFAAEGVEAEWPSTALREDGPAKSPALLFPGAIPTRAPPDELTRLVDKMVDRSGEFGEPRRWSENPGIPAGYTYLGQFVNHDISFKVQRAGREADPGASRVPRLNLDTLYGVGPPTGVQDARYGVQGDEQTALYEGSGDRRVFRLGRTATGHPLDLPREASGIALIADLRNDNSLLVAQLTALFMRFHNRLMERAGLAFDDARRQVMLHYQSVVLDDFLPRLLNDVILSDVSTNGARLYGMPKAPFIPAEFSLAAYRLHTMTRNRYHINRDRYLVLDQVLRFTGEGGGRVFPLDASLLVDWRLFFPSQAETSDPFVNFSRRIDPIVASELHSLPIPDFPEWLQRRMKMPFGRPATLMLLDAHMSNGHLPAAQTVVRWLKQHGYDILEVNHAQLASGTLGGFANTSLFAQTPLFYYVLREAEVLEAGLRLGPLGSRIVAETIYGLLQADKQSILHAKRWRPLIPTAHGNQIAMSDIIAYVA